MSTTTTSTITAKPTPTWVPLKIEGHIPAPYLTPIYKLKVTPIHPTFGCELEGIDWKKHVSPELYQEVREVVDKYGVVVCRSTGLSNEKHIEFSAYFGDLDDVKPYQTAGRVHRLPYPELFDAGNIDPETGDVAPLTAAQVIGNKVNSTLAILRTNSDSLRQMSSSTSTPLSMDDALVIHCFSRIYFHQRALAVPLSSQTLVLPTKTSAMRRKTKSKTWLPTTRFSTHAKPLCPSTSKRRTHPSCH